MRIGASIFLFLVAGLLGVAELFAIIDPAGTKMADDGDPFGMPHVPWYQHAIFILIIVACVTVAARLIRKREAG